MENDNVVLGLIRKRAEIAGRLEVAQMQVRQLIIDVDNLDAVLRQFRLDIDLEEIKTKPVPPRHTAFHGQNARIGLNTLRETGMPLTTNDVTIRVMQARELNVADPRLKWTVAKRIGACLRNLRTRGQVASCGGSGQNLLWKVT